jgi:hypothetical protein
MKCIKKHIIHNSCLYQGLKASKKLLQELLLSALNTKKAEPLKN